jgi:hypothetical protein
MPERSARDPVILLWRTPAGHRLQADQPRAVQDSRRTRVIWV